MALTRKLSYVGIVLFSLVWLCFVLVLVSQQNVEAPDFFPSPRPIPVPQTSVTCNVSRVVQNNTVYVETTKTVTTILPCPTPPTQIPILVIACKRPEYLSRCLDSVLKYRPMTAETFFPIIVSQDCNTDSVSSLLNSKYSSSVIRIMQPNLSPLHGYEAIARHYKWALDQVFTKLGFESVIILEEDMEVSPDFFEYFLAGYTLLKKDPTLWCISAWNDNGLSNLVENASQLYRSDFFPGLGWMLLKSLWEELAPKWPIGYWDEFMRIPSIRMDRSCIRPEISRTFNFGSQGGVSEGQYYETHLKDIKLNKEDIKWTEQDLSYLDKVFPKQS